MQVDTGSPRDNHHMAYLHQIPSPLASAPEDYLATDLFPRSTSRQGSTQYLGDARRDHTGRYLGGAGVLWTGSLWAGRHQSLRTARKAGSRRRNEGCPRYGAPQNQSPSWRLFWYRNYGTGARWKAGVVQTPEGHRMVTIKAEDGEHHRRHYDQSRGRETDSTGLAAGEAEVKQEPGVEAPQTEAGETGAPLTSREPQSPGAPDTDSRPNTHDNQVGNDASGAQSDGNKEFDPGETMLRRSTRNRRPPDRYQP
ncbi:hypothetical protein MRX96_035269 [Rhipicephalus microplus]